MSEHIINTDLAPLFSHDDESGAVEGLLLYLDGELDPHQEPELFKHLAACSTCRQTLDSVLAFRRLSRLENLAVPPSVDAQFMKRLRKKKSLMSRIDRRRDRRPLWSRPTVVTLRTALLVGLIVFLTGLLLPANNNNDELFGGYVLGYDEQVDLGEGLVENANGILYVFYPGVTIEASLNE